MKKLVLLALTLSAISATRANAEPGGIILYQTSDWSGDPLTIHEREISNLGEIGWNDVVRSFTVTEGTWFLYRDDNYWGENPHDVYGPFTPGDYTFGENTDGPSANTTSLRRMPDRGIMVFEHTHFRGRNANFTVSIPRLPHAHDTGVRMVRGRSYVRKIAKAYVWGDTISSYWISSGQWTAYEHAFFGGYSGNFEPGGFRNDSISSLFRSDNRGGTEIDNPMPGDPEDERLLFPRNPVALDSGNWGDDASVADPARRGQTTQMDIRLNGFGGTFYTECGDREAFYHIQHLVRLPNKEGRAYFMVSMSNSNADLEASDGFLLVFRLDEDAYDEETDLAVDTPGTDGEYVNALHYNRSSPVGNWNHPGKMDVLGGVLVVAAEQWGSVFCDAREGSSEDAVLFYDVRDPERPRYWGKLTATELDVAFQKKQSLDQGYGVSENFDFGFDEDDISKGGYPAQVIHSVSLDHLNGDIFLSVGGNENRLLFRAKNGTVSPNIDAWQRLSGFGAGDASSNAHGMSFNSFEQNATDPGDSPGMERFMYFDGSTGPPKSAVFSSLSLDEERPRFLRNGRKEYLWPAGRPDVPGAKSEDASSLYVTTTQRPVLYIPDVASDARIAEAVDEVNGTERIPEKYSLQPVNRETDSFGDTSIEFGDYNRFYQVHLPDPPTTVTSPADDGPGSLRQVMANVNSGSVIDFHPSLNGNVIRLTSGAIVTGRNITIDASGLPGGITISGDNRSRVFFVTQTGRLQLKNLTIADGLAASLGGGILNQGYLKLDGCRVTNNSTLWGGGIWNEGRAFVYDSTISQNSADNSGGGLGNGAAENSLIVQNSTVSGNTAGSGGGIGSLNGLVSVRNSTIAQNSASQGSGIHSDGETRLVLIQSTIDNELVAADENRLVQMTNSIVASSSGDIKTLGANLVQSHTGMVEGPDLIVNPDLGLGALADNGGPTRTMLPLQGSPALDSGVFLEKTIPENDQRGSGFLRGRVPDLGAVETPDLNLGVLRLLGVALSPDLSPTTLNYTAAVSYRTAAVIVEATVSNLNSVGTLNVNGGGFVPILDGDLNRVVALNVGENNLLVRVSTPDGSREKMYSMTVTRAAPSSNSNLALLATSTMEANPIFVPDVTGYDGGVTSDQAFRLWAEAQESVAEVEVRINGGDYYLIPPPTVVAAGGSHSLAIREGATTVAAWGSNTAASSSSPVGQSTPTGLVGYAVAVAAGGSHSLVLESTGRVSGWGSNSTGQVTIPVMTGVLAIAAGGDHSLALTSSGGGTVVAWGDNSSGQTAVPAGLSGVIRIAAGDRHSLALKADGSVVAWGDNFFQQATVPNGLSGVVAIAAGANHSLALKSDGTVVRWGEELNSGLSDVPSNLHGVVAIAAGDGVSLALKGDGTILAWGGLIDCETEALVSGVTAIAAGSSHRLAVRDDGTVFAWGSNSAQQSNVPSNMYVPEPASPVLPLEPGPNTIEVRVTAEDGSIKLYTLTVEQDDAALVDKFEPAPATLDDVFEGTSRFYRNVTLIGRTIHFRVTGSLSGNIWGTDIYSLGSDIAQAAVHAGILADGEEGVVSLTIVPALNQFVGSTRNGVTSKNTDFTENPDPRTAIRIHRFLGDPFEHLREQYGIDPGFPPSDLRCYGNREGETLNFLVFGSAPKDPFNPDNDQAIWYQHATELYSHDSSLAVAAVHAGILEGGEMGVVAVTLGGSFSFNQEDEAIDTQERNGVVPFKRGDNHSSVVEGSFLLEGVIGLGLNDSDGDGLEDAQEGVEGTDPFDADSDDDGVLDGWEVANGSNPLVNDAAADGDDDGLDNLQESVLGTDPQNPDSDNDQLPDGWEVENGLNPNVDDAASDPDGDGLTNLQEFQNGTDPLVWNTGPSVQFVSVEFSVTEPEGTATIRVVRSGGTAGQVSVNYATADGTAVAGVDYVAGSATLTFQDGEAEKSFQVVILDNQSFEGGKTVLLSLSEVTEGASLGDPVAATLTITDEEDLDEKLYFAQFGNGEGFFSQIILLNPGAAVEAAVRVVIKKDSGEPYPLDLNGEAAPDGRLETSVPAGGLTVLKTDAAGPVVPGSVIICSDEPLAGVIVFGGAFGLAGVGATGALEAGFAAPVEVQGSGAEVDTGIAVQNIEEFALEVTVELLNLLGNPVATAVLPLLPGMGHTALFVTQMQWDVAVDFSSFQGSARVSAEGRLAATAIQFRVLPGTDGNLGTGDDRTQFATLPVVIQDQLTGEPAGETMGPATAAVSQSNFAHFANGDDIFSQIILLSEDQVEDTNATLTIRKSSGDPFSGTLNGEPVQNGQKATVVPPSGVQVFQTDAMGPVEAGSVVLSADRPLAGVIVFGGGFGLAGVGSSETLENGFAGPVETEASPPINTGIAIQNLEADPVAVTVRLNDMDGDLVATSELDSLPPDGQSALFVTDMTWDVPVDFSSFQGSAVASSTGKVAAAMIQFRVVAGKDGQIGTADDESQFATLPVVKR